jgi:hypothetical protein
VSKTSERPVVQDSSKSSRMIQPQVVNESFYKAIGLNDSLTKMFMDLSSLSFLLASSHRNEDETNNELLTRGIAEAEKYIDTILRGGWYSTPSTTKGVVAGRAFVVLSGYIYLYLFLRRIEVSSRLYDWMVSLLREDLGNIERTMRKTCSPELLFWVLFIGASGSVGRRESSWFMKELRVSKESLGLRSWLDARASLMKFAWVEGGVDGFGNEGLWCGLDAA